MKCASFFLRFKNSSSSYKRPVTKPTDDYNLPTNKEFITVFESSKPLLNFESKTLVIEPKINTWRPLKKLKNIHLPIESSGVSSNGSVEFESSAGVDSGSNPPGAELRQELPNGLNLRRKTVNQEEGGSFVRIDTVIANNLKDDLEKLPDAMGFDEYDDCPVDDFAAAVLRRYGWSEGRGIGRNTNKDVKVVDYERRTGREGIGFAAAAAAASKDARNRYNKDVKTRRGGDEREDRPIKKDNNKVRWLTSNIKVRIISKKLKRGKLYLRKGKVVDVVGTSACDILMDDSRELIQGVDQEFLETAIPRTGGPILVLYGKYKGVYGSLLQKDMEQETAIFEDADTLFWPYELWKDFWRSKLYH